MRRLFLVIGISTFVVSNLAAQTDIPTQNQTCSDSSCCTSSISCTDCECYVPAFYNLQCDWGFFLDAELLYWRAKEDNVPYGAKVKAIKDFGTDSSDVVVPIEPLNFEAKWDPGIRAGLGWNVMDRISI